MDSISKLLRRGDCSQQEFEEAFLYDFPNSRENRAALEKLALRSFKDPETGGDLFAVCLKEKDVSVSQLAYALESLADCPARAKKSLPCQVTKDEWEALIRAAVLMLNALERHTPPPIMDIEVV